MAEPGVTGDPKQLVRASKFLSYVLRHHPEAIGLKLNKQGWAKIDDLISGAKKHNKKLDRALLDEVVFTNDKQRFAYSPDGLSIRASQGHSIKVDLELQPKKPPDILYHGTARKNLESIREKGLMRMKRHHVHLSALMETAFRVGQRYGKPVVLTIDTKKMTADGYEFFISKNGVWLTSRVPFEYIDEI